MFVNERVAGVGAQHCPEQTSCSGCRVWPGVDWFELLQPSFVKNPCALLRNRSKDVTAHIPPGMSSSPSPWSLVQMDLKQPISGSTGACGEESWGSQVLGTGACLLPGHTTFLRLRTPAAVPLVPGPVLPVRAGGHGLVLRLRETGAFLQASCALG